MRNLNLALFLSFLSSGLMAQPDTIRNVQLPEIKFEIIRPLPSGEILPDVNGFQITSGRKTNLVRLDGRFADLTSGQYRQALARVAGITIWENDGSGIQTSIATRGLSPNRSWEFNMRQDGADMSAEAFGYPEAYYSPPMEAVERIEITRGAASLAYGPQFGGVVNYQLRKAEAGSPLRFESSQTLGSFGTFNSFQSISGSKGNFFWTTWFHHRNSNGWRANSRYFTRSGYISLGYAFKPGLTLELSSTLFNMQSQQPGGLFDGELNSNPTRSHRSRNWMSTPWNLASVNLQHQVHSNWNYELKLFGNYSDRNSVGFVNALLVPDTINRVTGQYLARQVDRDAYRNAGLEWRNVIFWEFLQYRQVLSCGIRAYEGKTQRRNGGKGSSGTDYDLSLQGDFTKNLNFQTRNFAVYAEQLINFGAGFSLSPGARLEYLLNSRSGQGGPGFILPKESKNRMLPLLGLAGSWKSPFGMEVYANYSQAYRPVTFSELTPSASTETADAGLKDSRGFNSELGIRGKIQSKGAVFPHLTYDVNAFYLDYRNKVGLLKNLKTNIGNAESRGIEAFLEFRPFPYTGSAGIWPDVSLFISGCYMKARYSDWKDTSTALNRSGKAVEYAPELTIRTGIQAQWKGWNFSAIWNQVDAVYSDAMNLESPSANAQLGKLPGWQTLDVSAGFGFLTHYQIKVGSNNLLDERYATRRSGAYPGPGLLPGQARNVYASVSVRF